LRETMSVLMSGVSAIEFFDPRGRADRKGLAILAAILIGGQAGVYGTLQMTGYGLDGQVAGVFHIFFLWLGIVAGSKRLHDLDVSGWRLAGAVAAAVAWCFVLALIITMIAGEDQVAPGHIGFTLAAIGALLPVLAATLWLHLAKGNSGDNRYGPAPDASGFSRPWPVRRPSTSLSVNG
jgi:uncharacterized membrane protein YhaH (DUF805 family)